MLAVYGTMMPLRLLEEIQFWKMQEKEHTVVILELIPDLEPNYVNLLKEWEPIFEQTEMAATQWIEALLRSPSGITPHVQAQLERIIDMSIQQSRLWISQLLYMLNNSEAVQRHATAPVVIRHIIRESEYFLGVLDAFLNSRAQQQTGFTGYTGFNGFGFNGFTGFPGITQPFTPPAAASAGIPAGVQQQKLPVSTITVTNQAEKVSVHAASNRQEADYNLSGEGSWSQIRPESRPVPIGGHTLPPLPYDYSALEPYIDTETMRIHHDIHHKSYVDGLNKAEKSLQEARQSGNFDLIKHWEREAAFHGAGHYLHTLFWNIMNPKGGGEPTGALAKQISSDFGSFAAFKKHFSEAASKVEGGGWAILVWSPRSHRLQILQAEKHQNLSQWDIVPLLALDVWEHAYYLKHQNKRDDYIEDWWNVVYWPHVSERFEQARKLRWQPY